MQVPLPHASFPLGDTIPFVVTVLTNAQGEQWAGYGKGAAGGVLFSFSGPSGYKEELQGSWVSEAEAAMNWGRGQGPGLYRYTVRLMAQLNPYAPPHYYTLLRGTISLYEPHS